MTFPVEKINNQPEWEILWGITYVGVCLCLKGPSNPHFNLFIFERFYSLLEVKSLHRYQSLEQQNNSPVLCCYTCSFSPQSCQKPMALWANVWLWIKRNWQRRFANFMIYSCINYTRLCAGDFHSWSSDPKPFLGCVCHLIWSRKPV